jgi:hypothetical protein
MSNQVTISAAAALIETAMLCDYYRNRNLILAQENQTLREESGALRQRIDEMVAKVEQMQESVQSADYGARVLAEPPVTVDPTKPES